MYIGLEGEQKILYEFLKNYQVFSKYILEVKWLISSNKIFFDERSFIYIMISSEKENFLEDDNINELKNIPTKKPSRLFYGYQIIFNFNIK